MIDEEVIVDAVIDDLYPDLIYPYIPMDGVEKLPDRVDLNTTQLFSQYENKDTSHACTAYGIVHTKHDSEKKVTLDPRHIWLTESLNRGGRQGIGWGMKGTLDMFVSLGLIEGYTTARTIEDVKMALASGDCVYTGTRSCDFQATRENDGVFVYKKNGLGHVFSGCGYNDLKEHGGKKGFLKIKNSSFNTPTYRVAYQDLTHLYTCIVLTLKKEHQQVIKETVEERTLNKAIELGITNGNNLDENLKRRQLAVMIGRIIYGVGMTDEQYITKTKEQGIWNGINGDDEVIRMNALIMMGRAMIGEKIEDGQAISLLIARGLTNGSRLQDKTTRLEGILLVTRLWAIRNNFILA